MDGHNPSGAAWTLSATARDKLTALLREGATSSYTPPATIDQAITALVEALTAYFAGEAILKNNADIGKKPPAVANAITLVDDALRALKRLEAGVDSDTLASVGHSKAFPSDADHFVALYSALERRRDVLKQYRKIDSRTETKRVLCGYISVIWRAAAHAPDNRTSRRRFAMVFLDAASIEHQGANHPEQLDGWLATPVGPLPLS